MREMKDSGVAWIGEIPKEWELKSIRHLLIERNEKNRALSVKTILSLSAKEGVTLYNSENHSGNKPREDLSDYKIVREHDIVVNSMNILSGSVGLSDYEGVVSPVYYIYYPRYEDNIEYMHYIFQCFEFQRSLRGLGNGILIKETESGSLNTIRMRIPSKKLALQELPYCHREEQDRIVMALNSIIKKIDSLITNQQKQIERLKAYKQSLITEIVTKGLNPDVPMKDSGVEWIGEIPKDFSVQNIRSLFTIKKDIIGHEPDTVLSITRSGIKIKDISENNGQMADSYANYQVVNIGDFAMNHMDLLTGGIGISQYNGVTSPDYRVFNLKDNKMNPRYFLYIFETYYRNKIFYAFGQGAANLGRWRLPAKNFYSIYIPVAPIEEQQAIVSYLDQKCTQIDNLIAIKQKKIEKLQQYKKSLIYEYVTGKKEI